MGNYLIPLEEIADNAMFGGGGKGKNLAIMKRHGVPVPEAYCLTTEVFAKIVRSGEVNLLLYTLTTLDGSDSTKVGEILDRIRQEVKALPLPEEIRLELFRCLSPENRYAVRSSATAEDLGDSSFAGLYVSFLNVRGYPALELAIKEVWSSVFNERVFNYCTTRGLCFSSIGMAVIIQEFIDANRSGVLFTVNPSTGKDTEMLIETAWGLGESIVAGKVAPDRICYDWYNDTLNSYAINRKTVATVALDDGVGEYPLEPELAGKAVLTKEEIRQLSDLGLTIQCLFGQPQDIEWAIGKNGVAIVQARPITAINAKDPRWCWTTSDFKDGGVSAEVVTPLIGSLYETIFDLTMPWYLRKIHLLKSKEKIPWIAQFYAKLYWNCQAVKECMFHVPGFSEESFDRDLGIEADYEGGGRVVPYTLLGVVKAIPTLISLICYYRKRIGENKKIVVGFEDRCQVFLKKLSGCTSLDRFEQIFAELIETLYIPTESGYFLTIYNNSNVKLDFRLVVDKLNADGSGSSLLHLMSGLKDLSHLRPLIDLWTILKDEVDPDERLIAAIRQTRPDEIETRLAAMPGTGKFLDSIGEFIEKYSYHGLRELDLMAPRWDEDRVFVWSMIKSMLCDGILGRSPKDQNELQYRHYLTERARVEQSLPGFANIIRRRDFRRKLDRMRSYLWWREEMRDKSSMVYAIIRKYALVAGTLLAKDKVIGECNEVFFLRYEELQRIKELAGNQKKLADLIARRKAYRESFRHYRNPGEIGIKYSRRRSSAPAKDDLISGTGCAPGRVIGTARIVDSIDFSQDLGRGDILVTRFTDPGWTSILTTVSGVVTETGGLLSHAAVIAREYGIPAVLDVPDAMKRIKNGQKIILDGDEGTIAPFISEK